ncbi:MAG TPA: GDYXXLXY domain-containing protein, partial [Victivallales bacterium]|nr:GDYXXLXY domain-containing protein [Victivallales bacterium]
MRRFFIAMSVVVQISVLAYMAGYREFIILKGKTVFLRTMPVDPSDPFRGDYVSLEYEISVIGKKDLKSGFPANKGEVFYTVLKEEENGLFSLEYCSKEKPSQGELFIKGRYEYDWNFRGQSENFRLKYGIEKYFVQEDKGIEIEERAGIGDQMHIPLEVEVSVGKNGTAVAKGYRWSKLGIGL